VEATWFPELNGPATFSLKRAGGLAGQVLDADGRPVAKAQKAEQGFDTDCAGERRALCVLPDSHSYLRQ
jgi:hypothetical protein